MVKKKVVKAAPRAIPKAKYILCELSKYRKGEGPEANSNARAAIYKLGKVINIFKVTGDELYIVAR